MRFGEALIEIQRPVRRSFHSRHKLFRVENTSGNQTSVTARQVGIGDRVSRVNSYRLIEILDSLLPIFCPSLTTREAALEQQFISLRVDGLALGELLPLVCGQPQSQRLGDLAGNIRLHDE